MLMQSMANFDYRLPAALVGVIAASMTQIQIATAQIDTAIEQTAREISVSIGVRVKRFDGSTKVVPVGSGVLIAGQDNNYYVLTAAHNFEDGDDQYAVTTHDGNSYLIQERYPMHDSQLGKLDIVVARFVTGSSQPSYRFARWLDPNEKLLINSSPLREGATIYICGFPQSAKGLKVIRGQFKYHRPAGPSPEAPQRKSLGGYSLSYEADLDYGMSGSPILDQNGYLVGIHGRQEYEAQKKLGIAIDTFWTVAQLQLRNQILAAKKDEDRPTSDTTRVNSNPSDTNLQSAVAETSNPPAQTYQPGFWQPVARVNPDHPIKVQLINQTEAVLEYSLTTNEAPPRQLSPGDQAFLTHLPRDAHLLIYPTHSSTDQELTMSLKFEISVTKNVVTVKIRARGNGESPDRTIDINPTGAIYVS